MSVQEMVLCVLISIVISFATTKITAVRYFEILDSCIKEVYKGMNEAVDEIKAKFK